MITSLAASIIVLCPTLVDELVFDIFMEDRPLHALGKRPVKADDDEERPVCQKTSEGDEELDEEVPGFVLRMSREEEKE